MGSASSRLNSADGSEVVPSKIRPFLIGKFEEFRKRRSYGQGTLSKKQLLKDAAEEEADENSQSSSSHHVTETAEDKNKNKVLPTKEIDPPPSKEEETVVRVISNEKLSRVVPMPNSECETVKEEKEKEPIKEKVEQVINKNPIIDLNQERVNIIHADEKKVEADVKTEEEVKGNTITAAEIVEVLIKPENEQEVSAKSHDGDDDDDGSDSDEEPEEFGRFLCPGSPSFRIYCIEAEKRKEEEEKEECKSPAIVIHQKSYSVGSIESVVSRNSSRIAKEVNQIVEMESAAKRKGHKMKRFGAVKTLLKVKSFYQPMCTCTGEDKSHLVAAKTTN